jgi:hypothetical protein
MAFLSLPLAQYGMRRVLRKMAKVEESDFAGELLQ